MLFLDATRDSQGPARIETRDPVEFDEVATASGHRIGLVRLNDAAAGNPLTLPVLRELNVRLRNWEVSEEIACVVIAAEGDADFSVGADLRGMRRSVLRHRGNAPVAPVVDNLVEHARVMYRLQSYGKPVLAWANGEVIGAGLGLFMMASHRVVTPTVRMALSEVRLGALPDVAACWRMQRQGGRVGLFLALTGAAIDGEDSLGFGLAHFRLPLEERSGVFDALTQCSWRGDATDFDVLSETLRGFAVRADTARGRSSALLRSQYLDAALNGGDFLSLCEGITRYEGRDPWIARAASTLALGSPTTARMSWELHRRFASCGFAEALRLGVTVALQCCSHPDFVEGVHTFGRAQRAPRWTPSTALRVSRLWIEEHLAEPVWPRGAHPLAGLA